MFIENEWTISSAHDPPPKCDVVDILWLLVKAEIDKNAYKKVVGFRQCLLVTGGAWVIFMNWTET